MGAVFVWTVLGFLVGSIPFSLLLGQFFLRTDIRRYGDGNPGGTNAWKAGGAGIGLAVIALDIFKGFLPVFLARQAGLYGWSLIPVALAPPLGHAFSPFLKFHGGKALAATGGVWTALIGPQAFLIYALLTLPVLALQEEHAWAAVAGMLALLAYVLWFEKLPWMIAFALFNLLLIAWTHRTDLLHGTRLRPWAANLLAGRGL